MAWIQGDYRAAHCYLDEGVTMCRQQGDKQNLAFMLTLFGLIAALFKEYEVARDQRVHYHDCRKSRRHDPRPPTSAR